MKHHLREMAPTWFVDVKATLVSPERDPTELTVEAMHAHGGVFRLPGDSVPSDLKLGRTIEIEFCKRDTGTICRLACWVTHSSLADKEIRIGVAFLDLLKHEPGTHRPEREEPTLACSLDYPPLAWANHPFYDQHRLQFRVLNFFRNGMTLEFRRDSKPPIESLPLDLTLILPGLDSLRVSARVGRVLLRDDASPSQCAVHFEGVPPEAIANIGRYLFTAAQISVDDLEALGYPVPPFEYAIRFALAHTPEEINDMLALRLLAYRTRPGANLDNVTSPDQMRDSFDDHSLIFSLRVGNQPVGTGRVVFNDGDRGKSEIGRFVTLPDWLWEGGFVECSRVATSPGIRGRDVFSKIGRHSLRVAYQAGARYILADCEDHLLEPYKRRGSRELGLTFVHPLEGKTLHVIYSDVHELMKTAVGEEWDPVQ